MSYNSFVFDIEVELSDECTDFFIEKKDGEQGPQCDVFCKAGWIVQHVI